MPRHVRLIAAIAAVLLLAVAAGFLMPRAQVSTVTLLAVPRGTASPAQLAATLAAVLPSMDLFTKAAAQDPDIRWADFGDTDAVRRAAWRKTVRAEASQKTGIVTVEIRHADADQAGRIAQAVADVLVVRGRDYLGPDAEVRLLDAPHQK